MKTAFEHKPDFRLRDFVIEKTVTVSAEVFADMLEHPLENRPFIMENVPLMCQDGNGVYHCLLVTGESRTDSGIGTGEAEENRSSFSKFK